jgi:protein-L-isoaspartate(D-aspartate) O-methyltransferase
MMDYKTARRMMVDSQLRPNGVTDPDLVGAVLEVARERFVPADKVALAYLDRDLQVSEGGAHGPRHLLKPMVTAKLIQAAEVKATDHVLDIACGTGYSSAVLARLAGSVVALEDDPALAAKATELLNAEGVSNVAVVCGALEAGWPAKAPYDVILINGAVELVPPALCHQLKDGGRLVAIVGSGPIGKATIYRSVRGEVSGRPVFDAAEPLLPSFSKPPAFVF